MLIAMKNKKSKIAFSKTVTGSSVLSSRKALIIIPSTATARRTGTLHSGEEAPEAEGSEKSEEDLLRRGPETLVSRGARHGSHRALA